MTTVVIYGPSQTGKTLNAEAFREFYRCTRIEDGWNGQSRLPDGTLALTNAEPPFGSHNWNAVPIDKALAALPKHLRHPATPTAGKFGKKG